MAYTFPSSDFDSRDALISVVGGFWQGVYGGTDLVSSLTYAAGQIEEQTHRDLLALAQSVGRFSLPLYKKRTWFELKLRETGRNVADAAALRLDGSRRIDDGFEIGDQRSRGLYVWQLDPKIKDTSLILNTTSGAALTLVDGLDFFIAEEGLWFVSDPFQNDAFEVDVIFEGGEPVDRELTLWLYDVSLDYDNVYYQFGYALGVKLPTSGPYKELVNALFDSLVEGSTSRALENGIEALADIELAKETETVTHVITDAASVVVVTDKNAYRYKAGVTVLVAPGDTLRGGQAIIDAVRIYEFNRGQVPDAIQSLAVGKGFLGAGYHQDLIFRNKIVPLDVEPDVDGFTKVSFSVEGRADDVEAFWNDVHARGVAKGETLAMLMDQRPESARTSQPTAIALPSTVNPLAFLLQNIFRNNVIVAILRPQSFGPDALSVSRASFLRRVIPPQTACIVLVELVAPAETITMDEPASALTPGYEETITTFLGTTIAEVITPEQVLDTVIARQVAASC